MTAANDLGLTDAVPAPVTIDTDARRRASMGYRSVPASKAFYKRDVGISHSLQSRETGDATIMLCEASNTVPPGGDELMSLLGGGKN